MRKFVTLAAVAVLAVGSANCTASDASNSAGNVFPMSSPVSPSMLQARGGNGGGNGKGGGTGSPSSENSGSSLSVQLAIDADSNGITSRGDSVTFFVLTPVAEPNVELLCAQNGVVVYGAMWPLTPTPKLSSSAWQSGAAECTATLFPLGDRRTVLATLTFTAGA